MNLKDLHSIYFLGIGGIGMSALARYFQAKGIAIHGYDKTPSALTGELTNEGMIIHFDDNPSGIPDDLDLVIYTPAVPQLLLEFKFLKKSGIPMLKRAQVIGKITEGKITVAVAGTHGKSKCLGGTAVNGKELLYPYIAEYPVRSNHFVIIE